MSVPHVRPRVFATALLVGLIGMVAASCAPPPAPPKGIIFNAPPIGYVGKQFTPTASSTSNLPVTLSLDESSTGCSFVDGVVHFDAVGSCVINADQPGDGTIPADPRVQRTVKIYECPALRGGIWTGPQGITADVTVNGSTFAGYMDLSAFGYGVQVLSGTATCEVVNMTFNTTPLTGTLSPDGSTLSGSYNGISVVLHAPA